MTIFANNILLHNLRVGVQMVQHGMRPQVVSHAFELEGIRAPHQMLSALAEPGVIESLSSKAFTHARTREQIAAHDCMVANLVKFSPESVLSSARTRSASPGA